MTFSTVAVGAGISQVARNTAPPTRMTSTRTIRIFAITAQFDKRVEECLFSPKGLNRQYESAVIKSIAPRFLRRRKHRPAPLNNSLRPKDFAPFGVDLSV